MMMLAIVTRGTEIRRIATELIRMADEMDHAGNPKMEPCTATKPTELAVATMVAMARSHYSDRKIREKFFKSSIFGEPAWDMLLDLFVSHHLTKRISTTSLCLASHVPNTTALRYISALVDLGFAVRRPDHNDQRQMFVEITDCGLSSMTGYLNACSSANSTFEFEIVR